MYNLETYHQNGKKGKNLLNNSERCSALKSRAVRAECVQPAPWQVDAPPPTRPLFERVGLDGSSSSVLWEGRCTLAREGSWPEPSLGLCWTEQRPLQGSGRVRTGCRLQGPPEAGGRAGGPPEVSPCCSCQGHLFSLTRHGRWLGGGKTCRWSGLGTGTIPGTYVPLFLGAGVGVWGRQSRLQWRGGRLGTP